MNAASGRYPRGLFIVLVAIISLCGALLQGYALLTGYQEQIHSTEITTSNYAAILDARLDSTLRRAEGDLEDLAQGFPIAALTKQAVPRYARKLDDRLDIHVLKFAELAAMRIFDANGDLLYASDDANTPRINIRDRRSFREMRDNPRANHVFSEVLVSRSTGRSTMTVDRALRDEQGNFRGIVAAAIELQYFQKLFQSMDLGAKGSIALRRSDDQTLVARWPPLPQEVNKPLSPQNPIVKRMVAGDTRATLQFAAQVDGIQRIISVHRLERYPFYFIVGMGRDDALAGWRASALKVGVLSLLLLGVLCVVLFRLRRSEVRQAQMMFDLAHSEQHFRAFFESSLDAVLLGTSEGAILEANAAACQMFGRTAEEFKRIGLNGLTDVADPHWRAALEERSHAGQFLADFPMCRADGSRFDAEVASATFPDGEGREGAAVVIRDISERNAAKLKIERLTRFYAALSQCNRAITGDFSEEDLLRQICRIAVDTAGMRLAWVGKPDATGQVVELFASYGEGLDYLRDVGVSLAGNDPGGRGPTGVSMRENRPIWCQDFLNDPSTAPWHEQAACFGLRSSAALPLSRMGVVIGAFNIYSDEANAFDEQVRELLGEMAADINHALDSYAREVERKGRERKLSTLSRAIEQSPVSIMITDIEGNIEYVNPKFEQVSGYRSAEALGRNPRILSSGEMPAEEFRKLWDTITSGKTWSGELHNRHKNGLLYWENVSISPILDELGRVKKFVAVKEDITGRKASEAQIQNMAYYDSLTQLANRRLLMDRLKQALATHSRSHRMGALLLIDLDNFKTLNDTLGHDIGDLLLQQVAQRLATCVRVGDTVARLGGDEFVVMLDDLSGNPEEAATQTESVGEKILAMFSQPFSLAGHNHRSTPSIGVTLFADQQSPMDELLKQADLAMYQAKDAGRNNLRFFDPEMQSIVAARAALEDELREAINHRQFILYYQPQVVGDGRVTGAEALVRWQHPLRGVVFPADFIPLTEGTGLILPLGHWVLEAACTQLAIWAAQPSTAHLTLAVNVSAKQLHQANFVDQVMAVLGSTGANPQRLKLELTESVLVSHVEDTITKMRLLKAQGVSFSLDDFGTGYSSLYHLKRLPLDQLKIDQGFVRDILTDPNDAAIAKTVIALAGTMGMAVIAEGVETTAQKDFLASQGCHAYQGYLFSRPLPLEAFEEFVRRIGQTQEG